MAAGAADPPPTANRCKPPKPSSVYPPRVVTPAPARRTHWAADGTPFESTTNTMYQPGGARLGSDGIVTETPVAVRVIPRSTNRWFGSLSWVVDAGRTNTARAIGAAWVVAKVV